MGTRICLFFLIFFHSGLFPQSSLDSLKERLTNAPEDTARVILLDDIAWELRKDSSEAALRYSGESIELAKRLNYKRGLGQALHTSASIYQERSDYEKALENYFIAIRIWEETGDQTRLAVSYNNVGNIYRNLKEYKKSLDNHFAALRIFQASGNKKRISSSLNNIGNIYDNLGENEKALGYHQQALKLRQEDNDRTGIAASLNNIGLIYRNLEMYDQALDHYNRSLSIKRELQDESGMALSLNNIAYVLLRQDRAREARNVSSEALELAQKTGARQHLKDAYLNISTCDSSLGDYKSAYLFHKKYSILKDSIFDTESAERSAELQTRYDTEKKEKEIALLQKDKEMAMSESRKQQIMIWSAIIGLLLVIIFSLFILNRWRVTRKQKMVIEEQKKEITDSINYAKRIQLGILPSNEDLKKCFQDYFVLYLPKDIVSGDFYWAVNATSQKTGINVSLIAAVDCTGHGVPGAFMSMLGNTLLNQTIFNPEVIYPSDVLNFLNRELPQNLKSSGQEISIRDGMDMALCSFDWKNKIMYYAGANNPCWIIRDNELIELKPDKQAISASTDQEKRNFSNHEFALKNGDLIYIFTDGFADQFGGPEGKKFKYRPFKQKLMELHSASMEDQKGSLQRVFLDWKGKLEQVDDVLVIGIRI